MLRGAACVSDQETSMADKNIESFLLEERTFTPAPAFSARAHLKPADAEALRRRAREDHVGFWTDLAAQELTWHTPFTVGLDATRAPNYRWFSDGRLNASYNCLDVHLNTRAEKTAVIFEGEPGDVRRLTYRELHAQVCRFANALKAQGVERGDRVIIYMPLVPEILVAMHACNRIGAVHSVVFGGFSAPALRDRIVDTEPEWVDAEHPLYLLYTSGSTGKPKGIQHATGGYLLGAKLTTQWVFDLRNEDVFWCTADVGWVTGHTYVAYGPLALGATVVLYEGGPTHPDGARFWKNCETHGVTVFYTAPTAIRALMKLGEALPARHDLSRLRLLGTVGEPINPEAWMWYHRVIGQGRCPIVDTWWQTETGAILIAPLPGVTATKPGSCTQPLPGIDADIVDDRGNSVKRPDAGGYLVIRKPWPAMLRTIWRDNARYIANYWEKFNNRYYMAGDSAHRDKDGYFWIMGRIDDVLKVSGHRLGTMEIESALVAHPRVAEAAVVGKPHDIKGESVFAYVVLRGERPRGDTSALTKELREWVGEELGPIAKPDDIRFADNLPKTRSGKIMRRLLKAIARGEQITQDVSTLENPAILEQLRGTEGAAVAPAGAARRPATASAAPQRRPAAARRKSAPARRKARAPRRAGARRTARKPSRAPRRKAAARATRRPAPARRGRATRRAGGSSRKR